ncbi:MAG: proline iminopeptidase-family hydrolase [Sphingomonadaceae bacterium]|nr:proline iminopeptidase-family hydrolase [Sphingomonadaceae bacterium]
MRIDRRQFGAGLAALAASPLRAAGLPQPDPALWDPALPFAEGFAPGPNGPVYFRRYGGGARSPVIVLHGGPAGGHRYMRPYAALARERPVVLYDQSGCGRSAAPPALSRYTVDRYVAELEALRGHLSIGRAVLLGHSWGALLAPAYAAAHPARVAGLVLAGGAPSWRSIADQAKLWLAELGPAAVATAARGPSDPGYGALVDRYYALHLCRLDPVPAWFAAEGEAIAKNPVYVHLNGPTEFDFTGALASLDVSDALRGVRAPTLVTCGEFDEGPPRIARQIVALVPGARLTVFDGLSHMSHIEDPARVVAATAAFLQTVA